jgi:hypothetical protein
MVDDFESGLSQISRDPKRDLFHRPQGARVIRLLGDDLPLDETALQAAAEKMWGGDGWEAAGRCYPWDIEMADCREAVEQVTLGISTYLREAGFKVEAQYKTISAKHGLRDPERRLVGPWVPVVQAESEEEWRLSRSPWKFVVAAGV